MPVTRIVLFLPVVLFTACAVSTQSDTATHSDGECAVLLHGLARSSRSMRDLQQALSKDGYSVLNVDYPSTEYTIETLAELHLQPAMQDPALADCRQIHFVTHSMGGILLRYHLQHHSVDKLGRVVMLSPPNRGSELADKLGGLALFRWINGPAGNQLGTGADSVPNQLGPVSFELAVITGNRSLNPFYSWLIPGDDDGKVAVERARVDGMHLFKTVPSTHTFIMKNRGVIQDVLRYLKEGQLDSVK